MPPFIKVAALLGGFFFNKTSNVKQLLLFLNKILRVYLADMWTPRYEPKQVPTCFYDDVATATESCPQFGKVVILLTATKSAI